MKKTNQSLEVANCGITINELIKGSKSRIPNTVLDEPEFVEEFVDWKRRDLVTGNEVLQFVYHPGKWEFMSDYDKAFTINRKAWNYETTKGKRN